MAAISSVAATNCSVEWCCFPPHAMWQENACKVANATTNEDGSCTCVCETGWFLDPTNLQTSNCPYCGGHGKSFNADTLDCLCSDYWEDGSFSVFGQCTSCPSKFNSTTCASCNATTTDVNSKNCDTCLENKSFWDPKSGSCVLNQDCNAAYCYGDFTRNGAVKGGFVESGACTCQCKDGWFGAFGLVGGDSAHPLYGACTFCNGNGKQFDSATQKCTECENSWLPGGDCSICPGQFRGEDCSECSSPDLTPYPLCDEQSGKHSHKLYLEIGLPILAVVLCVITIWCCKRVEPEYGYEDRPSHSETIDDYRRIPSQYEPPRSLTLRDADSPPIPKISGAS